MALIEDFVAGRTPPDLYAAYLTPMFRAWADQLVGAHPPFGHVLDLACGTGIVSRALSAAPTVERVSAIDVAAPMVAKATALSQDNPNITFSLASADDLPFQDQIFDAVYCQQGLQFFPDKPGALAEARRVIKPGGRMVFAVWTAASDGCPAFAALEDIVARELGEAFVPFGPFSFGDPNALRAIVDAAGLNVLALEKRSLLSRLPDPRTLVLFDLIFLGRPASDGSLQPLFDPEDASKDALIEKMIAEYSEAVSEYLQSDGTLLAPMSAHILTVGA